MRSLSSGENDEINYCVDILDVKEECEKLFIEILEMIGENNMYNALLMIASSSERGKYKEDTDEEYKENTDDIECCCTCCNIVCLIIGMLIMYLYTN